MYADPPLIEQDGDTLTFASDGLCPRVISDDLSEVTERLSKYFRRAEPRERAISYLMGLLLSNGSRKNGCNLAAYANESVPDGMHRLLTTAKWDVDGVRNELRRYVISRLGSDAGVLAVGQTNFPKKGDHSAGVQRQYSESARRMENCQTGLFLCYISPTGVAFIDRELYLPEEWWKDSKRYSDAGITRKNFISRADLAFMMVRRAHESEVPNSWVVASEFDGSVGGVSEWLESRLVSHVINIRASARLSIEVGSRIMKMRADDILRQTSTQRLRDFQVGGTRWFRLPLILNTRTDTARWLVIHQSLNGKQLIYYHAFGKTGTSLLELARVASAGTAVNNELELAKSMVGLAEYEARRYEAWYRHVTLSLFAHALLRKAACPQGLPHALWPSRCTEHVAGDIVPE